MERSRLGLARNDGRKPCKVILLYIIFCRVIIYFRFVGFFIFFILFKGETPLSGARLGQCQLDSVINEVKDIVFPGKAYLSLGRVDIDIHKVSGHFQKQDSSRELALHRGAFERCFHGCHHGAVADIAPIDIEILHTAAGAAAPGLGDEAPHPVDPAGFSEERAEATSYSNYSYWGSTFRAFFKNKIAVALLIALVFVVGFAFLQPYLPGQADPNLCQVDSTTGIQFRNIAPGEEGFIWGSNAIGQDLWARIWAGARTSLTIAFFVALIEAVVGITVGVLWGYVRQLDFFFTELYNICDNVPSTIILILISYVASPSIQTLILGMSITGWIAMARFIRNQILIIRDRDYNVASRCIGTPIRRIVLRNLLPYLVSVIMLRMALTIPAAIGSEVFITYIGLGLSVETPSLGNLINDGRKVMMQAGLRYQLLYPTIILSFVTIAFYLIGNAFSDAADPKNHLQ